MTPALSIIVQGAGCHSQTELTPNVMYYVVWAVVVATMKDYSNINFQNCPLHGALPSRDDMKQVNSHILTLLILRQWMSKQHERTYIVCRVCFVFADSMNGGAFSCEQCFGYSKQHRVENQKFHVPFWRISTLVIQIKESFVSKKNSKGVLDEYTNWCLI